MKGLRLLFCLLLSLLGLRLSAQTYSASGGAIPDDGTVVEFPLTVSGLTPSTLDTLTFGLETVCLNITHTWDSDLQVQLIAPDSTIVTLFTGVGGAGHDFLGTCLNMDSATSIASGGAPFTGTWKPMGQMGRVNNGQDGNGIWKLRILDTYPFADEGDLLDWSITFGSSPGGYFSLNSSNLPIVSINTFGVEIPSDPKIDAHMGIIWNGPGVRNNMTDPFNHYDGNIGIEVRGSSSSGMPKKPYGFEFRDSMGNDTSISLLGFPPESDFALIASYSDKTLMRNAVTHRLWEEMGWYAPRGEWVELILNEEYFGIYYLCEVIKRDANRVDIAKLDSADISGVDVTGGYILKVDKGTGTTTSGWQSLYPPAFNPTGRKPDIFVHYPKDGDLLPQQFDYIKSYTDSFEIALDGPLFADPDVGFRHFIDEVSWIDYFLLTEFVKNLDGYRSSDFFYKDKGGKFLHGPTWDYDLSMGNGDFCDFWKTDGWVYEFGTVCSGDYWQVPFWWPRLLEDTLFAKKVRCRWEDLKVSQLSLGHLFTKVDSMALWLEEGQQRNFTVWPILGVYVWPNAYVAEDYKGEVDTLKWFMTERWAWLDANLPMDPSACLVGSQQSHAEATLLAYPNPFESELMIQLQLPHGAALQASLCDLAGRLVAPPITFAAPSGRSEWQLRTGALAPGMYQLRVTDGIHLWTQKIVRQ